LNVVHRLNAGEVVSPEEMHYRLLKRLEEEPDLSQRQLASELGISLGKVNYCLRALLSRGWIKVENFKQSRHKLSYGYLLTPDGVHAKGRAAWHFLDAKRAEYETIKRQIAELEREVARARGDDSGDGE